MGVLSLPWRWHILSITLQAGRGISAKTCKLDDMFLPDDFGSSLHIQFIVAYIPCIIFAFQVIQISSFWKTYTYQELACPLLCFGWCDIVNLSCLVSNVYFNCIVHYSLYHDMDIGTMWHCGLVTFTPSQFIDFFLCALFWCWVSSCVPFINCLIECYFIMTVATIIEIFMVILFILNFIFGLSVTKYFWYCNYAHPWIFLRMDILF